MLRNKILAGLVLLTAMVLLLGGFATGCAKSGDSIIGTWTLKGTAPKTDNPASAKYTLRAGGKAPTQEFRADGTYINPRGESKTWKRVNDNQVKLSTVVVTATIDGDNL